MINPIPIYLTLTMIAFPRRNHLKNTYLLKNMERNEPVCQSIHKKRRGHPEPIAREWLEIPHTKNDKPPTLLDYGDVGGPTKDIAADATTVGPF